jgi:hypothetical protein
MIFYGRYGNSCGTAFSKNDYCNKHRQFDNFRPYLKDRPTQPWTEFSINKRDNDGNNSNKEKTESNTEKTEKREKTEKTKTKSKQRKNRKYSRINKHIKLSRQSLKVLLVLLLNTHTRLKLNQEPVAIKKNKLISKPKKILEKNVQACGHIRIFAKNNE